MGKGALPCFPLNSLSLSRAPCQSVLCNNGLGDFVLHFSLSRFSKENRDIGSQQELIQQAAYFIQADALS